MVERGTFNAEVVGSTPTAFTLFRNSSPIAHDSPAYCVLYRLLLLVPNTHQGKRYLKAENQRESLPHRPQGTRKGYPYYGRSSLSRTLVQRPFLSTSPPSKPIQGNVRTASSMVGVPFTGTLERGQMGVSTLAVPNGRFGLCWQPHTYTPKNQPPS